MSVTNLDDMLKKWCPKSGAWPFGAERTTTTSCMGPQCAAFRERRVTGYKKGYEESLELDHSPADFEGMDKPDVEGWRWETFVDSSGARQIWRKWRYVMAGYCGLAGEP